MCCEVAVSTDSCTVHPDTRTRKPSWRNAFSGIILDFYIKKIATFIGAGIKTTFDYMHEGVDTPILAVADADPDSPGMIRARELGLLTFENYHDLYDRRYSIHLIIILTPEPHILTDILATRPARIRIMSCHVFELFWRMIGSEERKLREQKKAMADQLTTVSKRRLSECLGVLCEADIRSVDRAIRVQLALQP